VTIHGPHCFVGMTGASYYREQADHVRRLAEMTWQDELEALLRRVAHDYEEVAEDLEAGATEVRHPELLRE
jgi:hypothetical protein